MEHPGVAGCSKKSCRRRSFRDFEVVHEFFGRLRVMLVNGRRLLQEDEEPEGVLLAIEDVTARKTIEDELVRSNEDLQSFAYVAAHDLRSPLNSGSGCCRSSRDARRVLWAKKMKDAPSRRSTTCSDGRVDARHPVVFRGRKCPPAARVVVELGEPLGIALENLRHHIEEVVRATIEVGELPNVTADRTQM